MLPYFIVFGLTISTLYFCSKKFSDGRYSEVVFYIAMSILFLFATFRGNGNGDYFTYKSCALLVTTFQDVISDSVPMEIGFRFLSYVMNLLNLDAQFIIIFMNLLSVGVMTIFLSKTSKNKAFSLVIYFAYYLLLDMHHTRQAVAIAFICMAYYYFKENKYIFVAFFSLLAFCFHKSSIIVVAFFIIYLLVTKLIKKQFSLKFGIFSIVISYVFILFVGFDYLVINTLNLIGLENFANKFQGYVSSEQFGFPFDLYDPRLLYGIAIYIILKYALSKSKEFNNNFELNLWCDVLLVSNICMILLSEHTILTLRLSYYFTIISIIAVPNILSCVESIPIKFRDKKLELNTFMPNLILLGFVLLDIAYIVDNFKDYPYLLCI